MASAALPPPPSSSCPIGVMQQREWIDLRVRGMKQVAQALWGLEGTGKGGKCSPGARCQSIPVFFFCLPPPPGACLSFVHFLLRVQPLV